MSRVSAIRGQVVRGGYLLLCFGCIALGYIGMGVPLMPSTIFFIIALWAAKKSSPPLENWLLNHRIVGGVLQDWDAHRAIRPRVKRIILVVLWGTLAISSFFMKHWWGYLILAATGVLTSWFILTRSNGPEDEPASA